MNGYDTEYFGVDIHEASGVVVAVGAHGDSSLLLDEHGDDIMLSYTVSDVKRVPMINLYHPEIDISPTYYALDFGDKEEGHVFLDVAILRDKSSKLSLTSNRNDWNIPTYNPSAEFFFTAMTETEVCLFKATIEDASIELIETFSYDFGIQIEETSMPHAHRLAFHWI